MKYNAIGEITIGGYNSETEFITIEDIKRELSLTFDSTGSFDFDDDDVLLLDILRRSRSIVEEYTGVGLTSKTITVVLRNELGGIELPFQPYRPVQTPEFSYSDGTVITSDEYELRGHYFKRLMCPHSCYILATYICGYDADGSTEPHLPFALKDAWLAQAVYLYEHRGETNVGMCEKALNSAAPYVREWKSVLA
jgi:hypothetical protein